MQRPQTSELSSHHFDGIHKGGIALGQVQIAPQADPLHRLAGQRTAHMQPVSHGVPLGLSALGEGGQAAQAHREQVGMKAQLVHRHIGPGAQPTLEAGKHALDQPVEADGAEVPAVGLHAHPAVIVEDIGLLAVPVDDLHQRPGLFRHKALDKVHIVALVGRGRAVGGLQPAPVDEVLGGQGIAVLRLKGLQRGGADGEVIAGPVHKAAAPAHVAAKNPDEIVEQGGQPHHIGLGIGNTPLLQPPLEVLPGQRMAWIQLPQVFAGPVVGGVVVHVDLFPDAPAQGGGRIAMVWGAARDGNFAVGIAPALSGNGLPGRAVPHLPVGYRLRAVVQLELLVKIARQRVDGYLLPLRQNGV